MTLQGLKYCTLEIIDTNILIIRLNRPKRLNALHPEACCELDRVFNWFSDTDELCVAIVTGNGRAFCAGFDLKAFFERTKSETSQSISQMPSTGFGGLTLRPNLFKPVIAAVNGIAFGGGFEIALACDIIVASDTALFALPEPKVGLAALAGGLARLPRVVGYHKAMEYILTGKPIPVEEAKQLGIVSQVVPNSSLLITAVDLAKSILKCCPESVQVSKQCVMESLQEASIFKSMKSQESSTLVQQMGMSYNSKEALRAFNEKRSPKWVFKKSKL
mmetsp:Transcript_24732/g.27518  ORF Transcript_24732/g.27518 Transcript_24732/m.27518 type:complete len:275 (+) Transcript_24732:111-935(+)